MTNLIFLIIGFGLGCYYMWWKSKRAESKQNSPVSPKEETSGIDKINESRQNAKAEAKDKILKLFEGKTEITNDDVQRILAVSDATATNYLNELEQEGYITQIGKEGRGVKYTRK